MRIDKIVFIFRLIGLISVIISPSALELICCEIGLFGAKVEEEIWTDLNHAAFDQ